jgi:hypothetical protein
MGPSLAQEPFELEEYVLSGRNNHDDDSREREYDDS